MTAISFSSLVTHTHCPCWDAALLLQHYQNTISEAAACFKSPCTSTILKCMIADIFPDITPLLILHKKDCHPSGGGKTIPVPKQGSTVILLIYPKQDLTYQVLKAPRLCIVREVLISSLPLKHELGLSSLLGWFWGLSPTFSKPVQLSHHLRTRPQIEVFSVAAAS